MRVASRRCRGATTGVPAVSELAVRDLGIRYGDTRVVDGLSFSIDAGASLGLVGESGSGKTQSALAMLGLLPATASVTGTLSYGGREISLDDIAGLASLRATDVSMVFQDPLQSLNPYIRVGEQILRILLEHGLADAAKGKRRVIEMLERVGLPDPERQYLAWPHQLSGGMRQRAMIASALITEPKLLIADEPTTALDVTVQAQILDLLETIRDDTALLLITHDLGIVASSCERMLVLENGEAVEAGPTRQLFVSPKHPHTKALLDAAPRLGSAESPADTDRGALLSAQHLDVVYDEDALHAVRDVSLDLKRGETVALVGESGSGKSSLVRAMLGLVPAKNGDVLLEGKPLAPDVAKRPRAARRRVGMVFQDPVGSLNPQMRVADIVAEPLKVIGERPSRDMLEAELARVGLGPECLDRFPHQLSGGQAQRVAIARATITRPDVLVCDEAVAALDGRVRRQILDLLSELQAEQGLSILFISHDLAIVEGLSHRVVVMYLGRVIESAPARELFSAPRHPYTRALLDAVPEPDPLSDKLIASARGDVPSPTAPPLGCAFHPRCPHAIARCRVETPKLIERGSTAVACHRSDELWEGLQPRS